MAKIELPEIIVVAARCTMSFAVHGYLFEGELIQTVRGRLLRRRRNELGPRLTELPLRPVGAALDLRRELVRLRSAPPLERPGRRVAHLELRAGADAVVITYPRPLISDSLTDHPADRLYDIVFEWPDPA
jgi:hypothetical protein